jgi:hypothetical protein
MTFDNEQLGLIYGALQEKSDSLRSKIADLESRGFKDDAAVNDYRDILFKVAVLRNSVLESFQQGIRRG